MSRWLILCDWRNERRVEVEAGEAKERPRKPVPKIRVGGEGDILGLGCEGRFLVGLERQGYGCWVLEGCEELVYDFDGALLFVGFILADDCVGESAVGFWGKLIDVRMASRSEP